MSVRLAERGISSVLLDIEGTTTPLAFVHDVLFPFARAHMAEWIGRHRGSSECRDVAARLADEHAVDRRQGGDVPTWRADSNAALDASVERYAMWLMDRDRKSPGLKLLQGLIWEQGYQSGVLQGQVFADVPSALHRWHDAGLTVAIYSSGSELAQRRLFTSTNDGDLSACIAAYFDTAVGGKRDVESYKRIAAALGRRPVEMLFVSDVAAELSAARAAGCQVVLSVRPGHPDDAESQGFERVGSFDELC